MSERQSPPVTDSDLIYLSIKRLEAVAEKMMKREYDDQLDEMMNTASDWFQWAAFNIARRSGEVEDIDGIDPFERAALIAETMTGADGQPADGATIASAIRAWRPRPVSETTGEEKP